MSAITPQKMAQDILKIMNDVASEFPSPEPGMDPTIRTTPRRTTQDWLRPEENNLGRKNSPSAEGQHRGYHDLRQRNRQTPQ